MYPSFLFPMEITILISMFSLAWFIVGVFAGRHLDGPAAVCVKGTRTGRSQKKEGIELYVGNLSYDISERDLAKAFESFGKVISTRIIKNRFNGKSKGFGFVKMADRGRSSGAIKALNGRDLKGRRIVVNEAKSQARMG